MRYDHWDVILFPRDSHIPIQEFKTACYVSHDEYGRQLPTLTCYIASLPASISFRVSIHLWGLKAKPSAVIEFGRKPDQRVVYTTQVLVDGVRVFHEFYEANAWPQEIAFEKRSITSELSLAHRTKPLEFPPFHQNILNQSSWDARENNGRIKLLLSEQLMRNAGGSELDFGEKNDIVCFSFQHAPRDILEQAGVSWPIRNPLYIPVANETRPSTLQSPWLYTPSRDPISGWRSPLPKSSLARPSNPEPFARPKTDPPPQILYFQKPATDGRSRARAAPWGETTTSSLGNYFDDTSMDTWSTKPSTSNSTSTTNASMPDIMFASPPSFRGKNSIPNPPKDYEQDKTRTWDEPPPRTRGKEQHMVIAFREDQLGQIIEGLSPKRRADQGQTPAAHGQVSSEAFPPKMGPTGLPINTRPSAAAIARTASYPDFQAPMRNLSSKISPNKLENENVANETKKSLGLFLSSFTLGKENRVSALYPFDVHVNPAFPSAHCGPSQIQSQGLSKTISYSDISMRDPSSQPSSFSRVDKGQQGNIGKGSTAPTPAESGGVKSRKEGTGFGSPAMDQTYNNRHDQSLLPDPASQLSRVSEKSHEDANNHLETVLNDIEEGGGGGGGTRGFVPGHRSGMESLDSIGRVEKKLFSALGDELGTSFNTHSQSQCQQQNHDPNLDHGAGGMDDGTGLLEGLEDFDTCSPIMKRKRKGTLGGERGRSPVPKIGREEVAVNGDMDIDGGKPKLRGD